MTGRTHEQPSQEAAENAVGVEEAPLLIKHTLATEKSLDSQQDEPSILRRTVRAGWESGTICVSVAAFLFAFQASLVKVVHPRGVPVFQIVVIRSVLSIVASVITALARGSGPLYGQSRHWHLLAIRGLVGAAAMTVFYESLSRLPLADAITIIFCNPALCSLFAWALLGERFGLMTAFGCLASTGGVVLVARPPLIFGTTAGVHEEWSGDRAMGMALAFGGAFLTAGAYLAIRVIGKREPPLTLAMWFHSCAALSNGIPLLLCYPDHAVLPDALGWLCLLGIGGCSFFAQLLLNRGFQLQVASKAAAVNFTQVIYAHAFGAMFFHEAASLLGMLGALLIAVGVVAVNADKRSAPGTAKGLSGEQGASAAASGAVGEGLSGEEAQREQRPRHGEEREGEGGWQGEAGGLLGREERGEGEEHLFYRDCHGRLKAKPSFKVDEGGQQAAGGGSPGQSPGRASDSMERGLLLAHRAAGGGIGGTVLRQEQQERQG